MQKRQRLTGAQAIVATLRAHNVDTIFGIPGVHTLPIYDAIRNEPALRHILARHEQGAGFMAEGYARASGRPGVVCTITGPGVTNVATPVANAYADSTPLLVISSSLARASIGRTRGELHEVKNQLGIMEALTGSARAITSVEEIPEALFEAFHTMCTGRPRGAYIQIPLDILAEAADVVIPFPAQEESREFPARESIIEAAHLLQQARRPLIIAGAGVTVAHANEQLVKLAEQLHAPVLLGSKSHDVLPTEHPLVLSTSDYLPEALRDFTANADIVLVVGSKLGAERTDNGRLPLPGSLIHIDIDVAEIGHNYPATIGIVADAGIALTELLKALDDQPGQCSIQADEMAQLKATLFNNTKRIHGNTFAMLEGLQAGLPQNSIVVADMTLLGYACAQYLPIYEPRTFIHPAEFCTIGCGLPLALGAKIAMPERPVIALCGDGGFLLNVGELATAVQEKLPVVVVIFNDSTYATVKKEQKQRFNARYIATDLLAPDYVALAQAFHIKGVRVDSPAGLRDAVCAATYHTGPTVIDVTLPVREW